MKGSSRTTPELLKENYLLKHEDQRGKDLKQGAIRMRMFH